MELKKSKKAHLEHRRSGFFLLGLVFVLALSLMAFEYRSFETNGTTLSNATSIPIPLEDEIIPISVVTPPPPPPITRDIFVLVDNKTPDEPEVPVVEKKPDIPIPDPVVIDFIPIDEGIVENKVFVSVEEMPIFPGGEQALFKYLGDNIEYPDKAYNQGVKGKVYIEFIVDKDGKITNVHVKKGIGYGCDEEAKRIIERMPNWKPGKQRGRPVKVQYVIPINFNIR